MYITICRTVRRGGAVLAGAAVLAGCGSSASVNLASGQIALVCGAPVTKTQFASLMSEGRAAYVQQHKAFPPAGSKNYGILKSRVVALLVQHAEQAAESGKLGVHVTDAQVSAELKRLASQQFKGSETAFAAAAEKQGLTMAQVRSSIRSNLLQQQISDKLTANLKVHDPEIKAYYAKYKSQYMTRRSRPVRQIFVHTRAQAQALAQRATAATFAALAREHSLDPNAKRTGGASVIQDGTVPVAAATEIFSLPVGAVSKPVQVGPSWAVFLATGAIVAPKPIPLAQVRLAIVQYLLGQKQQQTVKAWMSGVEERCGRHAVYAAGYRPTGTTS
jgi:parvulin-like peptidyl-prolyl isomerase